MEKQLLNYGFVKINAGPQAKRIGRYISDVDEKKANIIFSYLDDIDVYASSITVLKQYLSNDISNEDISLRIFILANQLNIINHKADRKVYKYSAEHYSLIQEYNLLKDLYFENHFIEKLIEGNRYDNVILFSSFKDDLKVIEIISDLEDAKLNVAFDNHNIIGDYDVERYQTLAKEMILVISKNSCNASWLHNIIKQFIKYGIDYKVIILDETVFDKTKKIYHLNNEDTYQENLSELIYDLQTN